MPFKGYFVFEPELWMKELKPESIEGILEKSLHGFEMYINRRF